MEENSIPPAEKRVRVRAYDRTRLGRHEHVSEHTRSWPRQLTLPGV